MPEEHFCVHGHFYQPQRADPFTKEISTIQSNTLLP